MKHSGSSGNPTIICLTPVKNEEWILKNVLSANSTWADRIIVADQCSTDQSRRISKSFDKVTVIENSSQEFNEPERQRLLIDAARLLPAPRVLVAIDADEILSSNLTDSLQWKEALEQRPGTVIEFPRVELWETTEKYFHIGYHPYGYIDDGWAFEGNKIHSDRVPVPDKAPRFRLEDVVILHFQFCNIPRMKSKHRWYRCYERIQYPRKSTASINKRYSWMYSSNKVFKPTKQEWFEMYHEMEIDFNQYFDCENYWWDWEVLRMFKIYGTRVFRKLDIWDVDWEQILKRGLDMKIGGLPNNVTRTTKAWL